MAFENYDLYTLFNAKGKVALPDDRITLSLCENIGNLKSSCILKNGIYIIRLAGDINGENNNKNKFEIYGSSIKIYLAAGDICNNQEKYKVDLIIVAIKSSKQDKLSKEDNIIKYSESGCHYLIEIKQNYATIYSYYYGYNFIFTVSQIIIGIFLVVLGIYIKICALKDIILFSPFIVIFIGAFFPINIIFDLFRFYALLAVFAYGFYIVIFTATRFSFLMDSAGVIINIQQSKKYNIFLGILCGYPMIKMISIITIVYIRTSNQRLIHNIFLVVFSICGGIIGGFLPEIYYYIGNNIFDNYLIVKGLSYIFYKLVPPIDEQKVYDLAKTQNFEMINEMINSLGLIYPIIYVIMLLINKHLINILSKVFKRSMKYNETKIINNEYGEEECIETPYYETSN
jgi:hypothetical protein